MRQKKLFEFSFEELERAPKTYTIDDEFLEKCVDPILMLYALNKFEMTGKITPFIEGQQTTPLTSALIYYIETDEQDIVRTLLTKTPHFKQDWNELFETCVMSWNYEMYSLVYSFSSADIKAERHLELICDLDFLEPPQLDLFYFVLSLAINLALLDKESIKRCFILLINNDNKYEMLAVFLYKLNVPKYLKDVLVTEDVGNKPNIKLILWDIGLLTNVNMSAYFPLSSKQHWTVEMFTDLIKYQQYDAIKDMVEKCDAPVDEKVFVPCMIYLLNDKNWWLLMVLNERIKYDTEKVRVEFNKSGERTILRGPNYYNQFQKIIDFYKTI